MVLKSKFELTLALILVSLIVIGRSEKVRSAFDSSFDTKTIFPLVRGK